MGSTSVAVLTDSTADIPESLLQSLSICLIPNNVVIGNKSYEDGKEFSRHDFYNQLPRMNPLPTTAAPAVGKFEEAFEALLQAGARHVLAIHAASKLSGIFNASSVAALAFPERVRVFDSQSLTLGLGFQCLEAAEAARQGAAIDQVEQAAQKARDRARVFAMLDNLEYVHRSGRVSWTRARLGNLLQVKSFIELREGAVHNLGQTRTRRKGIEHLVELIRQQGPLKRLAILHTNAEEDAQRILSEINPSSVTDALVVNITTVIGTHIGPNCLGFAALPD
jgi:DegV family protein with EDD domain